MCVCVCVCVCMHQSLQGNVINFLNNNFSGKKKEPKKFSKFTNKDHVPGKKSGKVREGQGRSGGQGENNNLIKIFKKKKPKKKKKKV